MVMIMVTVEEEEEERKEGRKERKGNKETVCVCVCVCVRFFPKVKYLLETRLSLPSHTPLWFSHSVNSHLCATLQ